MNGKSKTTSLVLMTALVPTTGHRDLIAFAANMPGNEVKVLIQSRSFEPVKGELRRRVLQEEFASYPNVEVILRERDDAPQNPEDHPDFWAWWRGEIAEAVPTVAHWDFVVASEAYGVPLAEALGATFLPFDLRRELNDSRGTVVRRDPWDGWGSMLPAFKRAMALRVTFFGQESVGKTTFSQRLAKEFSGAWYFEYARPLMETVMPTVNHETMDCIHRGQAALQAMAIEQAKSPLIVHDTDLFSTVGYWHIMGEPVPDELAEDARELASDLYFLLPDGFPLTPDPLRFGGDKRESGMVLWRTLLDGEALPYVEVPRGEEEEKYSFIRRQVEAALADRWDAIAHFQRD